MREETEESPEPIPPVEAATRAPEAQAAAAAPRRRKKKRTPAAEEPLAAAEPPEDAPSPDAQEPVGEVAEEDEPTAPARLASLAASLRARGPAPEGRPHPARVALVAAGLLVALGLFASVVDKHYPLKHWLFWRYAGYWSIAAVFSLSCISAGHRLLGWLGGQGRRVREELFDSFCLGALAFFLVTFCAGVCGLLYAPTFFVIPLALLALGGRGALAMVGRALRAHRLASRRSRAPTLAEQLLTLGAWAVAAAGLLVIYATILPPENALFDSVWYHLGLAEEYSVTHAIRRSPEGWYMQAYPHLASLFYTWCFLLPWGGLFDRVEAAAHLELVIFLFTLLGTSLLARRLLPRDSPRFVWVVVLLFPGLYLYDSSLGIGADHVAALWGPFLFINVLRTLDSRRRDAWVLALLGMAGVASTKYSAAPLILVPTLTLAIALGADVVGFARTRANPGFWRAPALGVGLALVASAPHWLKNLVWYGNPIYPLAGRIFPSRPWSPAAQWHFEVLTVVNVWAPQGTLREKLRETLEATLTFSFSPHDWSHYHGTIPVFGSLFTLSLFALPFLRRTGRIWLLVLSTHVSVFAWYWIHHEDRYLQTLVPWMAAAAGATLTLVWRLHWLPRACAALLVGFQAVWGGDVPFYPAHKMLGKQPILSAVELVAKGHTGKFDERFDVFRQGTEIQKVLPPNAKLLLHESNPRLGIGRSVVMDGAMMQGGLMYGSMKDTFELEEWLRKNGVTHVAWLRQKSRAGDSIAGDLLFFDFIEHHTKDPQHGGGFLVAEVGPSDAARPTQDDVLYLGCERGYLMGVYPRTAMLVPARSKEGREKYPRPRERIKKERAGELIGQVRYVVRDTKCFAGPLPGVDALDRVATHDSVEYYVRR